MNRSTWPVRAIALLSVFALVGAGCLDKIAPAAKELTGPKSSQLEGLNPSDAAAKINFVPGSVVEIRQTFLGFGAKLSAALAGEKKEGTRIVVIDRFAPLETADVTWKLSTKVETPASVKARDDAKKAGKPQPEPVLVDTVQSGSIIGFVLNRSNMLYPPSYWPASERASAFGTSGIWLSRDVYDGLDRNRVATLDYGILDRSLVGIVSSVREFNEALNNLTASKLKIEDRTDIFKLTGDAEPVEWPLVVNGKEAKVAAYKARTWFGEIIVLKNRQNPLVLKMTLNPVAGGVADLFSGLSTLKALVGYEVVNLNDVQE